MEKNRQLEFKDKMKKRLSKDFYTRSVTCIEVIEKELSGLSGDSLGYEEIYKAVNSLHNAMREKYHKDEIQEFPANRPYRNLTDG